MRPGAWPNATSGEWTYPPFSAGYEYFFPDPSWPLPSLPPEHYTWDLDLTRR